MRNKIFRFTALCMVFNFLLPTTTFAKEVKQPDTDLTIEIGGELIDLEKLAKENNVDPYVLKESLERSLAQEDGVFSPWSNVPILTPNTEASETVVTTDNLRAQTTVAKKNQRSTAYVAAKGAVTANGKTPKVGMCAMHINVTTKTGKTSDTIVALGTKITTSSSVSINGTSKNTFTVEDRGAPSNRTTYWIDFYFGEKTTATQKAATNYGVKTITYSYSY